MQTSQLVNLKGIFSCLKILCVTSMIALQSCYSIRIADIQATPAPETNPEIRNKQTGFVKGKKVEEIRQTVKLRITQADATINHDCTQEGFYSVEYRVTFGMLLLNFITLGKVKKVKADIICVQKP